MRFCLQPGILMKSLENHDFTTVLDEVTSISQSLVLGMASCHVFAPEASVLVSDLQ